MRIGLSLGFGKAHYSVPVTLIQKAEALGYDSVWTAETYSTDALTPLAFIAAHTKIIKLGTSIAQLAARTPASFAMAAQTIDMLAGGGRMIVGLGISGPQIVEGWYGQPWGRPNYLMRDYVAIMKKIFRREGPVSHDGKEIQLPYVGPGSIGLGKPLKSILHGNPDIPIFLGTDTDLNVRMTAEVADGWMPMHFAPGAMDHYGPILEEGFAKRTDGRTAKDFEVHGTIGVRVGDDVKAMIDAQKPEIAMFVGGMGAKAKNFHKDAMERRGYGEAAQRIQDLFLAGRKDEATAAVPDAFVDEEELIGPPARIKERWPAWRDSGLTSLALMTTDDLAVETFAKIALA